LRVLRHPGNGYPKGWMKIDRGRSEMLQGLLS
jgi:hypothetical protein